MAKGWDLRLMQFEPAHRHSEMCVEYSDRAGEAALKARLTEVTNGYPAARELYAYAEELLKMQRAIDTGCEYRWREVRN